MRLLQATRYSVQEIELTDIPTSMEEALQYDDPEKSLQFHTGTPSPGRGGDRAAIFHGQGAGNDDAKDNILRYFRQVNDGIQTLLKNQTCPLILAGVDYLLPIYKQVNSYPNLVETGITGNPDQLKPEELQSQAWQIIEPYFVAQQHQTIAEYQANLGTGKTANNIPEVISAAYFQRIESLFVPLGKQIWGVFNPDTNSVQVHTQPQPGDEDLLDLAALHTLINGGKVYAVSPEKIPGHAPLAAILRY